MASQFSAAPLESQFESREDSIAKALEENEENAAIEAEMAGTTEDDNEPATEENTTEGDKAPLGLLGKRAGEPGPTDIQPELKKQKLKESNTEDVAIAAPPQAEP